MRTLLSELRKHNKPIRRYLHALSQIIELDHSRGWHWTDDGKLFRQDVEDSDECALCRDEQFWQNSYGVFWEEARWWYCGPLGWNCDYAA